MNSTIHIHYDFTDGSEASYQETKDLIGKRELIFTHCTAFFNQECPVKDVVIISKEKGAISRSVLLSNKGHYTDKEIREGHNIEKLFRAGSFKWGAKEILNTSDLQDRLNSHFIFKRFDNDVMLSHFLEKKRLPSTALDMIMPYLVGMSLGVFKGYERKAEFKDWLRKEASHNVAKGDLVFASIDSYENQFEPWQVGNVTYMHLDPIRNQVEVDYAGKTYPHFRKVTKEEAHRLIVAKSPIKW